MFGLFGKAQTNRLKASAQAMLQPAADTPVKPAPVEQARMRAVEAVRALAQARNRKPKAGAFTNVLTGPTQNETVKPLLGL